MTFFIKFFIEYVFKSKTRQGLIVLVILALCLCSFALLLLQSTMNGLQKSMMKRYQDVEGAFYVEKSVQNINSSIEFNNFQNYLKKNKIQFYPALILEVMLKQGEYLSPALVTGIDTSNGVPEFLSDQDFSGLILGADLGAKLKSGPSSLIKVFSPSHALEMFGDVPQFTAEETSGFVMSGFDDIDSIRAWIRISFLQNLIRSEEVSHLIFYNNNFKEELSLILKSQYPLLKITTWEDQRTELMWAFNLETIVMISLFTMMVILISLTIISACSLFLNKIHLEMFVFWLLGQSNKKIQRSLFVTFQCIIIGSIVSGLLLGTVILLYLDVKGPLIMPDVFLERTIPVNFALKHYVYSLIIPYIMASLFVYWSLKDFFQHRPSYSELLKRVQ